ncbi:hypothetical protein [Streptomyces jeddahensis]|uniref:Gram-positive cocci surface proteins LPxTG domain-containing protein n=1 Tax=Streptomyces jeddahensis TaxID=1716141 RepID=A0A177HHG1_9ACTN|nr:hypothetical protein [Streptomyces jeddahensis]OAH09618.1 hypothetical protein STSP_70740 [Streptomyces jeddahensis]
MTTSSRWRAALASAATAAVLVAAPLVGAGTAHAQYPPGPPSLGLNASTVTAGGTLTFSATGFAAGQEVIASILSREVVVGEYYANAEGAVSATVTIPSYIRPGRHTFQLVAHDPDLTLRANIIVRGSAGRPGAPGGGGHGKDRPPYLADTGSDDDTTLMLSAAAGGLVALGAGTMVVMRRRGRR